MKKLLGIIGCALLVLGFVSCEKDTSTGDNTGSISNGTLLGGWFANYNSNDKQSFTIHAEDDTLITGAHGTQVVLPAYAFRYSSPLTATDTVKGTIDITLIEVYSRSDMVRLNIGTEGYLPLHAPSDSTSLLRSGGFYYLKITKNGNSIYAPAGVTVLLPMANTGGTLVSPGEYNGSASGTDFYWSLDLLGGVTAGQDSFGNPAYQINDNSWGWTMAGDWFVPLTGIPPSALSTFKVQLPTGYTPLNCEVYLSITGETNALYPLNYLENGYYTNHYSLVPIGTQYSAIAVGYIDGELRYAITTGAVSEDGAQATLVFSDFAIVSGNFLANQIDALP